MNPDTHGSRCGLCGHPWSKHETGGCIIRLQGEQAEIKRLDDENNERFSRETEYQNRIRTLEARVRTLEQTLADISSYIQRHR